MKSGKKSVPPLSQGQQSALERAYRQSGNHRTRQRAQAILLSSRGYSVDQASDILSVDRDTAISRWIDAWQQQGINALAHAPRSGRPSRIDAGVEEALREILENPGSNLKALLAKERQKRGGR